VPLVASPLILFGRKGMAATDLAGLIAWLKANPSKASMGVGAGGPRVVTAFFQRETGTHLNVVPYRGTAPRVQDLVAGQIDLSFGEPDQMPLVQAGSIKPYAVTSDTRLVGAPDIPTFRELGLPTLFYSQWYGLFAPARTPRDIVEKVSLAAADALADPAVQARLAELGFEIFARERQTPETLDAMVKTGAEKWWPIIKELQLKAD
jgi:tripartite-type tricarboxylate transporter receptor subunit TctC